MHCLVVFPELLHRQHLAEEEPTQVPGETEK